MSSADTLIKAAVLPLAYAGMYFMYRSKSTMHRAMTTNIESASISGHTTNPMSNGDRFKFNKGKKRKEVDGRNAKFVLLVN